MLSISGGYASSQEESGQLGVFISAHRLGRHAKENFCLKQNSCFLKKNKNKNTVQSVLHWHQRQTYPEQTYCNTGGLFLCFILCHSMKTQSCFQKAEQTSKLPLEFALTLNSLHKEFKLQKIRTGRGCERNNSMKIHNDLQQRQRPLEEQQ